MCDPLSMTTAMVIGGTMGAMTLAGGTASAIMAEEQRDIAKDQAKENYKQSVKAANTRQQIANEANTEESLDLSTQYLAAKGRIANAGLGASSAKALLRAAQRDRNDQFASIEAREQNSLIEGAYQMSNLAAQRDQAMVQIGDTSGRQLGMDIFGAGMQGATTALQIGSMGMSGPTPGTGTTGTTG